MPYIQEGEADFIASPRKRRGRRKLAQAGLTFSYHNHSWICEVRRSSRSWTPLRGIRSALSESELDVYWVQHGGGDPATWVRKVSGRMRWSI